MPRRVLSIRHSDVPEAFLQEFDNCPILPSGTSLSDLRSVASASDTIGTSTHRASWSVASSISEPSSTTQRPPRSSRAHFRHVYARSDLRPKSCTAPEVCSAAQLQDFAGPKSEIVHAARSRKILVANLVFCNESDISSGGSTNAPNLQSASTAPYRFVRTRQISSMFYKAESPRTAEASIASKPKACRARKAAFAYVATR